jgi:hypothetical protein
VRNTYASSFRYFQRSLYPAARPAYGHRGQAAEEWLQYFMFCSLSVAKITVKIHASIHERQFEARGRERL